MKNIKVEVVRTCPWRWENSQGCKLKFRKCSIDLEDFPSWCPMEDVPDPNDLSKRLEPYAQGCFSGDVAQWPQLKPLLRDIYSYLVPTSCQHEWVSAVNRVVQNGEVCLKCNAVRS